MASNPTVNQRQILKLPAFPLSQSVTAKFKNWKHPKEGTFTQELWNHEEDNYVYVFHWGPHNGPFYSQQNRQAFPDGPDANVEVWLLTGEKWSCFK